MDVKFVPFLLTLCPRIFSQGRWHAFRSGNIQKTPRIMERAAVGIDKKVVDLAPSLKRYAYSLTMNDEDAQDLFQETCYKALSNQDKFDFSTKLKAWLFTIMKNTFINDYRKRARKQTLLCKDVQEYVLNNRPAERGPESDFGYGEITRRINSLEPEFRIPFQMHEGGYKYQEIADELGLKLGTVKSRIHISRQKLMEMLKD